MCDKKEEKHSFGDVLIGLFLTVFCEICLDFACKQHQLYIFYVGKLTRLVGELVISLVNSLTLKCHDFSVNFNIVSALFAHQSAHLAAKNRFSRRFVLMQKGGGCTCRQNEFLFKQTATNTRFCAVCC